MTDLNLTPAQQSAEKIWREHRDTIFRCADLSSLSYTMAKEQRKNTPIELIPAELKPGDEMHYLHANPSDAIIIIPALLDKPIIVAFPGTDQWQDIKADLMIMPMSKSENLMVPPGPNNALYHKIERYLPDRADKESELVNEVFARIEEHNRGNLNPQPVVFTGHSLGGAMATLAAAKWIERHPKSHENTQLITFNTAPPGPSVASYLNTVLDRASVLNVVDEHDPVSKLALLKLAGTTLTLKTNGESSAGYRDMERIIPRLWHSVENTVENGPTLIKDHGMININEKLAIMKNRPSLECAAENKAVISPLEPAEFFSPPAFPLQKPAETNSKPFGAPTGRPSRQP